MNIFPPHATDFYKTGHASQYSEGTEYIYSNFTCRSDKHLGAPPDFDHKTVFFGLQGLCQWLFIDLWNREFFAKPKEEVVARYQRRMDRALGVGSVDASCFARLHDLGYLPLHIKALPEGSRIDIRTASLTIVNTHPDFYWLTNFVETQLSAELWKSITSATTAYEYRRLFLKYARLTGTDEGFVDFQGHDFSARGMSGIWDGAQSGAGHLTSFKGTDTVSAIDYLEEYYPSGADEFIGGSVPATEHSVMCCGGAEDEIGTFRRLITKVYPAGIVSIVSDTWDFWKVLTEFTVTLKDEILAREGKVVFRPDSGDPVKIIVGHRVGMLRAGVAEEDGIWDVYHDDAECFKAADGKWYELVLEYWPNGDPIPKRGKELQECAIKGAVQCLWEVFGGTKTATGHKLLDSRVGLIYGDSISFDRAQRILEGLLQKGFASGNIVFGIGSYTYQFVTRDTLGTAIKATWAVVNGEARELSKNPKTDDGVKKSAQGLIRVEFEDGRFVMHDRETPGGEGAGLLEPVFFDGKMARMQTLTDVRARLAASVGMVK